MFGTPIWPETMFEKATITIAVIMNLSIRYYSAKFIISLDIKKKMGKKFICCGDERIILMFSICIFVLLRVAS